MGTTATTQSQEIFQKSLLLNKSLTIRNLTAIPTPLASCDFMLLPQEWPPLAPHYTPYKWLQGACGWLHCSFQSAVTHQSDTARPMVTRPSVYLCHLGTSMWVYVTYGPGSASRLAYRGSEKSPLKFQTWVPRRNTSWKSHRNRGTAPQT
jgi:hypothetical protein